MLQATKTSDYYIYYALYRESTAFGMRVCIAPCMSERGSPTSDSNLFLYSTITFVGYSLWYVKYVLPCQAPAR